MPTDTYKKITPYYDAVTAKALFKPRQYIATLCALHNFTHVLDVGCGTGELVHMLNSKNITALGLDNSQSMIQHARQKQEYIQNNTQLSYNFWTKQPPKKTKRAKNSFAQTVQEKTPPMGQKQTPLGKTHEPTPSQNMFIQGNALNLSAISQTFDTLIYALILHETNENAQDVLKEGFTQTSTIIVLEWHAPERNLDFLCTFWVHGVERLAGKEHYANYRKFIRTGGIFGLAHQVGAKVITSKRFLGGSMICAMLHKE